MVDKNALTLSTRIMLGWILLATVTAVMAPLRAHAQTPLPSGCQEIILDGGFEVGDQWLLDVTPWNAAIVAEGARSGQQAAFIGLRPEDENVESHSLIQQSVAFPADAAQISLSVWLRPLAETDDGDRNYVLLLSDEGELIAVPFFSLVSGDAWQEQVFDITELAGQTLNMQIGVSNNGADRRAALLVDDVSITACNAAVQSAETTSTEPIATPSATLEPTSTPSPTVTLPPSLTPSATPSPQPTATERILATPTPLATDTPTATRALAPTAVAPLAATATSTPTPVITFDIEPPQRQLPLLDSQAAPILIGTLVSSVIILVVLALNTRRPDR